jgi:hypothetical protein
MPKESSPSAVATEAEATAAGFDEELSPHVKTTLYFTFAFCVAWSWDLVVYGASHVMHGISPMQNQLSFGDSPGPKRIFVLVLQYLFGCGAAAIGSHVLNRIGRKWTRGAYSSFLLYVLWCTSKPYVQHATLYQQLIQCASIPSHDSDCAKRPLR